MKNGRFSEKNVSNALRLTTAGSASTCPKSGLTVAVRLSAGVTAYLRSTPTLAPASGVRSNGLPASTGIVATSPTTYGASSSRFDALPSVTPVRSPNEDTNPLAPFDNSGHEDVSLRRATVRATAKPRRPSPCDLNRSCENGMRNSADHPSSSRRATTSQTASQLSSLLASLNQYESCFTPAGLTPN